jgi:ubiquinone biosynthesis protein
VHDRLNRPNVEPTVLQQLDRLRKAQEHTNRLLSVIAAVLAAGVALIVWFSTR